jgi:hypothetical protein
MRNYAMNVAAASNSAALIPTLMRCVQNYLKRKELARKLRNKSFHEDYPGLNTHDIDALLILPLSADFQPEIDRLQLLAAKSRYLKSH